MAFHTLFLDSFDHYSSAELDEKWSTGSGPGTSIDTSGTVSRTGLGCLECTQVGGPTSPPLGNRPNLILGVAFNPGRPSQAMVVLFQDLTQADFQCYLQFNLDGSLSVINHYSLQPGPTLVTTPAGLVRQNDYNYVELAIIFCPTTNVNPIGEVYVRVNGLLVASATNVNTTHSGNAWCDAVSLIGPPADADSQCYFDDFYVGYSDTPGTITNDFQGVREIYPYIPSLNETPLQWTPLAGTNFSEVNQIPPPGDAAYVQSGTIGQIDQYKMQPIPGHGPSGGFTAFGQVVMSAKIDAAGSAVIAPDVAGTVGPQVALTTTYEMFCSPYDVNPATGIPFTNSDFTTTFMGPKVTG